ncbi:cubilin [Caerostris extrusa]|uniref:Cubilin n=1 Tax=Caerostris extrusa TaxID=172846 RepID=A0AAV4UX10_CAEEX|nr:cubilin [Caerostris extrusa]
MSERLTLGLLCHWKASNYSIHWPNVLLYLLVCREFRHEFTVTAVYLRKAFLICPFDFVKVFDGATSDDPLIGTHCGQQRNLVIYSSAENVSVQFITLQRTAESENRGFSGYFEFSNRFVSLEFIGKNDGEIIFVVQNVIKRF